MSAAGVLRGSLAAAAMLLAGCGFHLEGRAPLPAALKSAYLQTPDEQSEFVLGLRRMLEHSGAELTDDRARATAVIRVLQDKVSEQVLSVSPSTVTPDSALLPPGTATPLGNQPIEYEITYTVRFAVSEGDREVLPVQEVTLTRDYSFDEHQLLAKANESDILRRALARNLADIVMRRLSSL